MLVQQAAAVFGRFQVVGLPLARLGTRAACADDSDEGEKGGERCVHPGDDRWRPSNGRGAGANAVQQEGARPAVVSGCPWLWLWWRNCSARSVLVATVAGP